MISNARFTNRFLGKAAIAAALVGLGDVMFFQWRLHAGYFGLFGLALLAGMIAARPRVRRDTRALLATLIAGIFAFAMIVDPSLLGWTMFWIAAGMAALLPATGRFDDGWRWFQRLLHHGFRALIAPILDALRLSKVLRTRDTGRLRLQSYGPSLVLPLFGSLTILILFAAANPVIEQWLVSIHLPDFSSDLIPRMLLWIVLTIAVWSLIRPRLFLNIAATFAGTGEVDLPGVSVASVRLSLIAFNLLFAIQNLMDIAYLSGALPMPPGITLAEYAHRGAYPLIVTALLAALFVIITLRPGSSTAAVPLIRTLVMLWIAQNILLVGSSIIRTLDYIEAYSLTIMRISALMWMMLVAVGLMLIGWRLLKEKSARWLINANLIAASFLLTIGCFVDLGSVAAWWNVRHARETGGRGAALDLCYLQQLGDSALLPLIAVEQHPGLTPDFRERVRELRRDTYAELKFSMPEGWTLRGAHRLKEANRLIATLRLATPRPTERDCEGTRFADPTAYESGNEAGADTSASAQVTADVAPPPPAADMAETPDALTAETRK